MLPNCHLRSSSGQGLPRFLGGCPSIECDRVAWVVKRKPAMLLQHFVIIYLSFFFSPSSLFLIWFLLSLRMSPWFPNGGLVQSYQLHFLQVEGSLEPRLDPSFVPRKVLLPERCQLKSIVSGALWLSAVEAIFWNQGSFLASSPTSRFDSAWL